MTFSPPFQVAKNDPNSDQSLNDPTFAPPNAVHIARNSVTSKYDDLGHCLYCLKEESSHTRVSDEHIVPAGLRGTLVLLRASCHECSKITGTIEGSILRTVLWAPRGQLDIKSNRRKQPASALYPITVTLEGQDTVLNLPIEQHPTILLLVGLNAPRVLCPRSPEEPDVTGIWTHTFGDPSALYNGGAERIASPGFDTVRFCQMLAKIAHAFATAKLGSNFLPILPAFILRRFRKPEQYPDCFNFVGGEPTHFAPSEDLHTLGYQQISLGWKTYLVVLIRLFANLGAPVFRVVAGEL